MYSLILVWNGFMDGNVWWHLIVRLCVPHGLFYWGKWNSEGENETWVIMLPIAIAPELYMCIWKLCSVTLIDQAGS